MLIYILAIMKCQKDIFRNNFLMMYNKKKRESNKQIVEK